jgi:predicted transcriptional regulator
MIDNHTLLSMFADSPHRREVLSLLRESDGPLSNATLIDRSSADRSTVRRAINHLVEPNWMRKTPERKNALTVAGHLVLRADEAFCEQESESTYQFLARSPARSKILHTLAEDGDAKSDDDGDGETGQSHRFGDIVESVDHLERAVRRAINDCIERQWVSKKERAQFALTAAGRRVIRAYDTLETVVTWTTTNASALNKFDNEYADIDIGADLPLEPLAGKVTAIEGNRTDPDAPLRHYNEQLTAAQPAIMQGVLPVVSLGEKITHDILTNAHTELELIVDETVLAAARSSYPDLLATVCESERMTLLRHPAPLGVGAAIFDGTAVLGAFDEEDGHQQATLSSAAEPFVEYVASIYDEHRERSTPLDRDQPPY